VCWYDGTEEAPRKVADLLRVRGHNLTQSFPGGAGGGGVDVWKGCGVGQENNVSFPKKVNVTLSKGGGILTHPEEKRLPCTPAG